MKARTRSWWASMVVLTVAVALAVAACGPEATRTRDGGPGASSRPEAPPTKTSEPALVVQPTTNIPYATEGPLPTLPPPRPAAATPAGGGTPQQPGFGVPTNPPGTFVAPTPGAAPGTPTR